VNVEYTHNSDEASIAWMDVVIEWVVDLAYSSLGVESYKTKYIEDIAAYTVGVELPE
jgi:hypothetical protein